MPQTIQFEGQTHVFPDDFTSADIQHALISVPSSQAPAPAPVADQAPAPPISGPNQPVPAASPERLRVIRDDPVQRPVSLLPSSVGGAVRDFQIGSQGVGKGLTDIVTGSV
jgi:hypothetical protein